MRESVERFLENFGKAPETAPPPIIPQRWRVPVFATAAVVSGVLLVIFLWLVVIPAIQHQRPPTSGSTTTAPAHK